MRKKVPPVSQKKAKMVNKIAVAKIVKNLKDGRVSVVFPSGGEYEFLPWKGGLAKIITNVSKKKIRFLLYKIKFKKFSELKLMLHFMSGKRLFSSLELIGSIVMLKENLLNTDVNKLTNILKAM